MPTNYKKFWKIKILEFFLLYFSRKSQAVMIIEHEPDKNNK